MPPHRRRLVPLVLLFALAALALPSAASAQATRTWVSGVGDDVNPCSRTAPCRTFAGAISKTAAGGVINALDPGNFGALNITKSLTVRARTEAGILAPGTNGIVVNAGVNDKVVIDGLDITGTGTGAPTALAGIRVLQARSVQIRRTDISRTQVGVAVVPNTASATRVTIHDGYIHDNGVGVFVGPSVSTSPFAATVVRRSVITENTCGLVATGTGPNAATPNASTDCGTAAPGAVSSVSGVELLDTAVSYNGTGVYARGGAATVSLSDNTVNGNNVFGLRRVDGGQLTSFGSNVITNNTASDAPTFVTGKI